MQMFQLNFLTLLCEAGILLHSTEAFSRPIAHSTVTDGLLQPRGVFDELQENVPILLS